jgi:hypothetical protein
MKNEPALIVQLQDQLTEARAQISKASFHSPSPSQIQMLNLREEAHRIWVTLECSK